MFKNWETVEFMMTETNFPEFKFSVVCSNFISSNKSCQLFYSQWHSYVIHFEENVCQTLWEHVYQIWPSMVCLSLSLLQEKKKDRLLHLHWGQLVYTSQPHPSGQPDSRTAGQPDSRHMSIWQRCFIMRTSLRAFQGHAARLKLNKTYSFYCFFKNASGTGFLLGFAAVGVY